MTAEQQALLSRITQVQGVCGGRPCVRATRIRVADVLEMLAAGTPEAEILTDFPALQPDDIRACLLYAALRVSYARVAA